MDWLSHRRILSALRCGHICVLIGSYVLRGLGHGMDTVVLWVLIMLPRLFEWNMRKECFEDPGPRDSPGAARCVLERNGDKKDYEDPGQWRRQNLEVLGVPTDH
jgi:hypothetical protein